MKRITGKTAKSKKNNIKLGFIVIITLVLVIITIVLIKMLPTIRTIDVVIEDKDSVFTKEEILNLSKLKIGDKLYKNLRSDIEKTIEENPYIESAKIERELSGKVTIKVKERKPIYMINYAGEYIYIDREGYILEVNKESNNTTILIGFITDFSGFSIGETKVRLDSQDLEKLEVINNIFATLKSNGVENKITSVDVTDKKNFILKLDEDGKSVYLGDGTDLNTRVLYMKKILQAESEHKGIIYINNNLDEGYVYFKEQE